MTISLSRVLWLAGASAALSLGTLAIALWRGSGTPRQPAPGGADGTLAAAEHERVAIVQRVRKSIVRVSSTRLRPGMKVVRDASGERMEETLIPSRPLVGSGFIYSADGRVATNFHVVSPLEKAAGEKIEISVVLEGEAQERRATLLATDDVVDLAILQIENRTAGEKFPALPFGSSGRLPAGSSVVAFGYPFQMPLSPTAGMVSNPSYRHGSPPMPFLLVDCRINPGNSGGPVVNLAGEVVGVMTRVTYAGPQVPGGGSFGLAIPADFAVEVLQSLDSGHRGGWTGFVCDEKVSTAGLREVVVSSVTEDSPASRAGLRGGKDGDVITEISGVPVRSYPDLRQQELKIAPGQKLIVTVRRNGRTLNLPLTAVAKSERTRPPDDTAAAAGITVRTLRTEELALFKLEEGVPRGVIITAVARGSEFEDAVEPGDYVRLVRNTRNEIHQLTGAADFQTQMEEMAESGGEINVNRGDHGDWVPFSPYTR